MPSLGLFCGFHPCSVSRRLVPLVTLGVVATSGCRDDGISPTEPAPTSPLATVSTTAELSFYQVSAGGFFTCGVTTDNRAYCWGANWFGTLGDGTQFPQFRPAPVGTTLRFRQVSAGASHACGVTTDYRAYCWGDNSSGQLGDGTTADRQLNPVAVAGGRQFRQLDAGGYHTCGVSYPENRAYCWGGNDKGQLGDGTTTDRRSPVAVAGSRQFRQVSSGYAHACGLTTSDLVFCWGSNGYGQIGDSSAVAFRLTPSRVAGTRQFRQMDAGSTHTCAVTTDERAFCWGNGRTGAIGNGRAYLSFWPRAVAGGIHFERVSAGGNHTCGETTLNRAYCWGGNTYGQLGDGTTSQRLTPVAVAGGLSFSQVSAGNGHSCGRNPGAVAYCWGYNRYGQVGDGTGTNRLRPAKVAGAM